MILQLNSGERLKIGDDTEIRVSVIERTGGRKPRVEIRVNTPRDNEIVRLDSRRQRKEAPA